jgi:hypothetical protein
MKVKMKKMQVWLEGQLDQRLSLHLLGEHFLRHDVETNVMSDNTLLAHLTWFKGSCDV